MTGKPRRKRQQQTSSSGYWKVELTREFRIPAFAYGPGKPHRVSEKVYGLMRKKRGTVASAKPD